MIYRKLQKTGDNTPVLFMFFSLNLETAFENQAKSLLVIP